MSGEEDVFIIYFTDDDVTKGPTPSPTPVPPEREFDFKQCNPANEGTDGDTLLMNNNGNGDITYSSSSNELWGVAPVDFIYSVSMNSTLTTSSGIQLEPSLGEEAAKVLLSSISNAIIDSIYVNECSTTSSSNTTANTTTDVTPTADAIVEDNTGYRRRTANQLLRRRQLQQADSNDSRRRLGIQSISPGIGHIVRGDCSAGSDSNGSSNNTTTTFEGSEELEEFISTGSSSSSSSSSLCKEIYGNVIIGFDDIGEESSTFESVGSNVLARIQQDMIDDLYLDQINKNMEQYNVVVTKVEYTDSNYFNKLDKGVYAPLNSADWFQPNTGLSTFTKVAIPIIVLLFMMMACCCWCSYSSYAKMLRDRFRVRFWYGDNDEEDDDEFLDNNLYFVQPHKKPKAIETVKKVDPQPNDLSRRSSFMDVPHCNKPECRLCRHRSNHRSVSMIGELSRNFGGGEAEEDNTEAPSFETTLEGLSDIKSRGYDDDEDYAYPMSTRTPTYSTIPVTSRNRFSFPGRSNSLVREPSLIRIVAEDKHNKDGFYNEPDMVNFVKVDSLITASSNQYSMKMKNQPAKEPVSSPTTTAWNYLSSFFGRSNGDDDENDNGGREFVCDPRGRNFKEVEEDERSYGNLDFKSFPIPRNTRMYSFTPSYNSNSKGSDLEPSRTSRSLPKSLLDTTADGSASYNDHTHHYQQQSMRRQRTLEDPMNVRNPRQMAMMDHHHSSSSKKKKSKVRRQQSLEDFNRVAPIQIGRKRTLTDEFGRVRQEVAL